MHPPASPCPLPTEAHRAHSTPKLETEQKQVWDKQ